MWFFSRLPKTPPATPMYGVNLGGWLVLEKWMTPSLFEGSPAADEYTLCREQTAARRKKLNEHRRTFITLEDFEWLQEKGITAVRLPVGSWIFGDEEPYSGAIEYVDKAFDWAEKTGIRILLDMHGAPGSQNGWDHSGRSGTCGWHIDEANITRTLAVLTRLAERYGARPGLLGLELLNEPKWTIPKQALQRYYEAAYEMIRRTCGDDVWVVFSDNFRPRRWRRSFRGAAYQNIFIDTHQYQTFNKRDKRLDIAGHLRKTLGTSRRAIGRMAKYHPVIVGEWSAALDPQSLQGLTAIQSKAAHRAYAGAQLIAFEQAAAWFYWSYKTEQGGVWSFKECQENGMLPNFRGSGYSK